uniref:Mitochondrial import receptor subunit TOM7 homolog n=1 Tax=Hyaloperonospora arabidopsidis (strain Emoy2) TaxID=559515 RepID=M4BY52_HYAAE
MASKKLWKAAPTQVLKVAKPIVHWGFVPLIVYIALKQDPSLTLMQIINPFAAPAEQA